jgi:hypothetical protein
MENRQRRLIQQESQRQAIEIEKEAEREAEKQFEHDTQQYRQQLKSHEDEWQQQWQIVWQMQCQRRETFAELQKRDWFRDDANVRSQRSTVGPLALREKNLLKKQKEIYSNFWKQVNKPIEEQIQDAWKFRKECSEQD